MIILNVVNCPPKLRGALSKWLCEINTGIYIGKVSRKVREELWDYICNNVNYGQATMIYSTNNEQGFEFLVHNTTWVPINHEGIVLIRRSLPSAKENTEQDILRPGFSKAFKHERMKNSSAHNENNQYVILDLETTGLNSDTDRIIEIGALRICNDKVSEKFQCLIKQESNLPKFITKITGITDDLLEECGIEEKEALEKLMSFIGRDLVVGYNVFFDLMFLEAATRRLNVKQMIKKKRDVLSMARRKVDDLNDFKLETVASFLFTEACQQHRAIADCELVNRVYMKLKEIE